MFRSFVSAFSKGARRVVLVGTDIPGMDGSHISEAFRALADHDMVLGPSSDGGYWLVGLTRPAPVFEPVEWGTGEVLQQTTRLAKKQGLDVHQMNPLSDVDTPRDLSRMAASEVPQHYISVIIPALNEAKTIGNTIEAAKHPDSEILVVDGGSRDDTVHVAISTGATVVHSPPGRARQQNRGSALAEGRVLLFLHADTRLPSDYPACIFEALMDPGNAAGAFRFKTDMDHPFMKLVEAVTFIRSRLLQLPYGDQALFVRKSLFQKIGGFPEVPVAEEIPLLKQLGKHGRIRTLRTEAVTSARRWRRLGMVQTTWINQLILIGLGLHISPETLARLYRLPPMKGEGV
jgi:rSAM/selenodomain-associated transferase 2